MDPTVTSGSGSGGFVNPKWLAYSEVRAATAAGED